MILETAIATKQIGAIIATGAFLGIGFWASKKFTNFIDEKLLMFDSRKLKQLADEMEMNDVRP